MSGLDELLAAANKRWSRAMDRAKDVEDLGLGPAVKLYYTRYFPFYTAALIALGAGVGLLTGGDAPPDRLYVLVVGFAFAMVGNIVGGIIYNRKKVAPAVRLGSVDVLYVLADEERRHIGRQIAGRASLDREHLPVVRAGAIQLRKSLATQLIFMPSYAFFIAVQAASFAIRDDLLWLPGAMLVLAVAMVALLVRDFKRTGRILAMMAGQ